MVTSSYNSKRLNFLRIPCATIPSVTKWQAVSLVCLAFRLVATVRANTEIVNFEATSSSIISLPFPAHLAILTHRNSEQLVHVLPQKPDEVRHEVTGFADSPHDVWLLLDLDAKDWLNYSKFTLRISWPASSPADFAIRLFSPEECVTQLSRPSGTDLASNVKTRQKLAHITVIDTGVRAPSFTPTSHVPPPEQVPFIVLLEPLYLGVLPASVLPTLLLIIVVVISAAAFVLPFAQRRIFAVAREVHAEISATKRSGPKFH